MVEIQIQGLNKRQRVLADIIWACDTRDEVNKFIKALPTKALREEADNIVTLMIMATVEQAYEGITDEYPDANKVIQRLVDKK